MAMEIIVGLIGTAFVVWVIFMIITLHKVRKVAKKTDHVLSAVYHLLRSITEPSVDLIQHTDELVRDVKKKAEGLDVLFHPLYEMKKEKSEEPKGCKKICDLLEYVSEGIHLFNKIKNEMKR